MSLLIIRTYQILKNYMALYFNNPVIGFYLQIQITLEIYIKYSIDYKCSKPIEQ